MASASPPPSPSASAAPYSEGPLYNVGGDIYTIDRDGTLYYYYQADTDGSATAKQEVRYGRNLRNKNAQLRIRIPVFTKHPEAGTPFAGLGNIELGYSYSVKAPAFNHSLEIRSAFASESNGVQSQDTELKGFYTVKWKWPGGAVSYINEFDQTIVKPPGAEWTSYYEGKLTLPDYAFRALPGLKVSAVYNFRVLFDTGGIYKPAAGATLFGNLNQVALSVIDTWGIGKNGLWRYKFEANATARF